MLNKLCKKYNSFLSTIIYNKIILTSAKIDEGCKTCRYRWYVYDYNIDDNVT